MAVMTVIAVMDFRPFSHAFITVVLLRDEMVLSFMGGAWEQR